jgi:hypothetical protein
MATTRLEDRDLDQDFSERFEELVEYCRQRRILFTKNFEPTNLGEVRQCPAYKRIVRMGERVLPLIRQELDISGNGAYSAAQIGGLIPAIKEIVGEEFAISEKMQIPNGESIDGYTDRICNSAYQFLSKKLFGIE